MRFTILEDARSSDVEARRDGDRVLLSAAELERSLGWTLKPQGLCRDETCVPVAASSGVVRDGAIDLAAFASHLGRPIALDVEAGAASLGDSASDRGAAMKGCLAPDFTLPDLSGRMHSLGDYRGRKALLVAWASW